MPVAAILPVLLVGAYRNYRGTTAVSGFPMAVPVTVTFHVHGLTTAEAETTAERGDGEDETEWVWNGR